MAELHNPIFLFQGLGDTAGGLRLSTSCLQKESNRGPKL